LEEVPEPLFVFLAAGSLNVIGVLVLGAPSSKRIIEDTEKVIVALMKVYKNNGCLVAGLEDRSGKRRVVQGEVQGLHNGGYRPRKDDEFPCKQKYIHPHADKGLKRK
jgi:hypothetical protein